MTIQLDFESLFQQALNNWPEVLDLSTLEYAEPDLSRYTVKGLGVLSDEIEDKIIGSDLEVISSALHIAIYTLLLSAAKFVLEVKRSSIRPEMVKLIFEERLKAFSSRSDLNWNEEDYKLVESYFSQNK